MDIYLGFSSTIQKLVIVWIVWSSIVKEYQEDCSLRIELEFVLEANRSLSFRNIQYYPLCFLSHKKDNMRLTVSKYESIAI